MFVSALRSSLLVVLSWAATAQDLTSPIAQRLAIHSNVLNEDRVIYVRVPAAGQRASERYPVLYLLDGGVHIRQLGATIDFLAANDRMPPMIIVGIVNTDRWRDLTPSHANSMAPDGTIAEVVPTSGGGDKFLDFIQTELMPEIERRYATEPFRILAGHSLGALTTVYTLVTRPDLFDGYIAASPSMQWDDFRCLHQAQRFFAKLKELKKSLFVSLANEDTYWPAKGGGFGELETILSGPLPKGFTAKTQHFHDEDHDSTVLLALYAGLRTVFADWRLPIDSSTGLPIGGLDGIERHYREMPEHYGYRASNEQAIDEYGYAMLQAKNFDAAIAAFRRNVELHGESAKAFDSLADALEAAGHLDLALETEQKALVAAVEWNDPAMQPLVQKHLDRLNSAAIAAASAKLRK